MIQNPKMAIDILLEALAEKSKIKILSLLEEYRY